MKNIVVLVALFGTISARAVTDGEIDYREDRASHHRIEQIAKKTLLTKQLGQCIEGNANLLLPSYNVKVYSVSNRQFRTQLVGDLFPAPVSWIEYDIKIFTSGTKYKCKFTHDFFVGERLEQCREVSSGQLQLDLFMEFPGKCVSNTTILFEM